MIKSLISLLINVIDPRKEKSVCGKRVWDLIFKLKKNSIVQNLVSWGIFLVVPYVLFNFMDSIGIKETAAELQPQVVAIHELNTQESLDKQLDVIWRTPQNYHLMKQLASYANRDNILEYYSKQLEKNGWKSEGMSEFYGYENGYKDKVLLSQTYTWAKGKYKFEIIFDLEDLGTKENYTEDGRLEYYINVKPVS